MSTRHTWARRLPRSNPPQPDETLAGYVINLAYRLGLRPKELVHRIGLKETANAALLDLQYAVTLPDEVLPRFTTATGLTELEARHLTLERHFEVLVPQHDSTVARTMHSNLWLNLGCTRYCPECLADTNPTRPDHSRWQIAWLTPWAIACTRHQRLLLDTCTTCTTPTGTSGGKAFASVIPNLHRPVTHPAACRAANFDNNTGLCDARLDHVTAPVATSEQVALQHELDGLLRDAPRTEPRTLGLKTPAAQRLRDLRLVTILLQLAPEHPEQAPFRVLTQPPADTAVAARLLEQAAYLLNDPANATELNDRAQQALQTHHTIWKKAQATGAPSDGLAHALKDSKNGIVDPVKVRAYAANINYNFSKETVSAYLDQETYQRHFADIPNLYQRPIRRCVPIALVKLVGNLDTHNAGHHLGYDASITQAATARASDAFDLIGINEFRQRVARIANEHNNVTFHTDYQRLRNAFTHDWTIPDPIWAHFQQALLTDKLARADTPWERRRPAYSTWVWGLITHGDFNTAPMIRCYINGRASTNGIAKDICDLRRRAPEPHQRLVHDLAQQVRATIPG